MSKYRPTVQNALELHQKGDYNSAKLLYVKALEENAYDAQALQLLGVILYIEGEHEFAIQLIKNAISIDPTIYEAHNNLGNIYKSLEQYDLALEYYENAIELQPEKVLAHNNIANTYRHKEEYHKALEHYQLAIKYHPEYTEAHYNLASLFYVNCNFSEAQKEYAETIKQNPHYSKAYVGLSGVFQSVDKIDKATEILKEYLEYDTSNSEILILLAIYSWIDNDVKVCEQFFSKIEDKTFDVKNPQDKFDFAYKAFIEKLIAFRKRHLDLYTDDIRLPVLYIIGDSHCLSYSNLKVIYKGKIHRTVSKINIGCKAWHLSANQNNKYKEQFNNIVSNLQREAEVLVIFGEIDCRLDDGILKHYEKVHSDLSCTIAALVKRYVDHVEKSCKYNNIKALYSLVPAPIFDESVSDDKRGQLKNVISLFNGALQNLLPNSRLYDTFSITVDTDGESNQKYHLDGWHLSPITITLL